MACERYEVLLVDAQGQAKQKREWTAAQLLGSVPWLKRMNARGHNIYVKPAGQKGLILLDGLQDSTIRTLERLGFRLAAKIQLSEEPSQVWLRVSDAPVSERQRAQLIKELGVSPSKQPTFGMLAGFIRHESPAPSGRNFYVLAHETVNMGTQLPLGTHADLQRNSLAVPTANSGRSRERPKGHSR